MMSRQANMWIGITIGFLAGLLVTTLLLLFVPSLRPLVGLDNTVSVDTTTSTNVVSNLENKNTTVPEETNDVVAITASENISVTAPDPDDTIESPFVVSGSARVFENIVSIRLLDADGTVLAQTFASAEAADVGLFGDFEINVSYDRPSYDSGTLEVYQESARDGSEQDLVSIPVNFAD